MPVIGSDDIPFTKNITPSLTTIWQPRRQIGEQAMIFLLDRLAQPDKPLETSELDGDLIVRNSCAAPKSEPPLV